MPVPVCGLRLADDLTRVIDVISSTGRSSQSTQVGDRVGSSAALSGGWRSRRNQQASNQRYAKSQLNSHVKMLSRRPFQKEPLSCASH